MENQLERESSAITVELHCHWSSAQSAEPRVLPGRISVVVADQESPNSSHSFSSLDGDLSYHLGPIRFLADFDLAKRINTPVSNAIHNAWTGNSGTTFVPATVMT